MRRSLVSLSIAVLVAALASTAALAQDSSDKPSAREALESLKHKEAAALDCDDIATQKGAQALFDMATEDRFKLDEDGDGVACEGRSSGTSEDGTRLGAKTGGDRDCMDFASQKAAQAYLREKPADPYKLDPENNGVACEIRPTDYKDAATDLETVAKARSDVDLDCDDFEFREEAMLVWFRDQSDPNELGKHQDRPRRNPEDNAKMSPGPAVCQELPVLPSNGEALAATPVNYHKALSEPLALISVWPRGGSLGLLLDLGALLMVASGALVLLVMRRPRSHGGE